MNINVFISIYSPHISYTVTYKDVSTEKTLKGKLLNGLAYSLSDVPYICIDNYEHKVLLKNIISITATAEFLDLKDNTNSLETKDIKDNSPIQDLISYKIESCNVTNLYYINGIAISKTITASITTDTTCDTILHLSGFIVSDYSMTFTASALITKDGYYVKIHSSDPAADKNKPLVSGHYKHYNLLACVANCVNGIA